MSHDTEQTIETIQALGENESSEAAHELLQIVDDPTHQDIARELALVQLANIPSRDVRDGLKRRLEEFWAAGTLVEAVVETWGWVASPSRFDGLLVALQSSDPDVRYAAIIAASNVLAMGNYGAAKRDRLTEAIRDLADDHSESTYGVLSAAVDEVLGAARDED